MRGSGDQPDKGQGGWLSPCRHRRAAAAHPGPVSTLLRCPSEDLVESGARHLRGADGGRRRLGGLRTDPRDTLRSSTVGEKMRVSDSPNLPAPSRPPRARRGAARHQREPGRDTGTTLQPLTPPRLQRAQRHLKLLQGELQPRSCACSTAQRGWEVDGGSQLPPVPSCCHFTIRVLTAENRPLRPFRAAATLESQNHAVTTGGPLQRRWGFGGN